LINFITLENKLKAGKMNEQEPMAYEKYMFMDFYEIDPDKVDSKVLREFYEESKKHNYYEMIFRLIKFINNNPFNKNEEATIDGLKINAFNNIRKLLKALGFTNIFDTRTITVISTNETKGLTLKKLESMRNSYQDRDLGRYRSSDVTYRNILSFTNRIVQTLFGISIKSRTFRKKVDKKRKSFISYNIEFNQTILDYVLLKRANYNNSTYDVLNKYYANRRFARSDLHGIQHTLLEELNRNNVTGNLFIGN
jgi:hypothetical protein